LAELYSRFARGLEGSRKVLSWPVFVTWRLSKSTQMPVPRYE